MATFARRHFQLGGKTYSHIPYLKQISLSGERLENASKMTANTAY
jgi:hypothetical protein